MLVTGDAAVQHDIGSALARALTIGELYLAVPAALLILLLVFGTGSAFLPFLFAAFTIPPALGVAWGLAHVLDLSNYLLNMVMMIGLGIAIDYSLLVVNRYRDERRRGHEHTEAVSETMLHAGRTIVFSGLVVSLGLALMILLPVPFLRGFGVGGLLIPVLSIACALTLLPVMLLTLGERLENLRLIPRQAAERRHAREVRLWTRHTRWVMKRARFVAPLVAALLLLAAAPLIGIKVGPSSLRTLPQSLASVRGLLELQGDGSRYSSDPTTIIIDSRGMRGGRQATDVAIGKLDRLLRANAQVESVSAAVRARPWRQLRADRDRQSPRPGEPAGPVVCRASPPRLHSGRPLSGHGARARRRRSRLRRRLRLTHARPLPVADPRRSRGDLPGARPGIPVAAPAAEGDRAQPAHRLGRERVDDRLFPVGLGALGGADPRPREIESWIPVFMVALLFGLAMDYEVFLVSPHA